MNISTAQKQHHPDHIHQLCPFQCSIAFCLNQLRRAKIQFINLGNLIVCPKQNCLMIFQSKLLIRIDTLTNMQQS